jgi:nucleotide-binding universal stress UspA family protein
MKLLVPTDFSKNAQKAIDYAVNIATGKSQIILLHSYQIIDTDSASRKILFEEYNLDIARKLHDELKVQKRNIARIKPGTNVTAVLNDNNLKGSIVEASEQYGVDFIVMGTQGASGLKKVFMGSFTARVIGNATVPVLAIPRMYKWRVPQNILFATNRFETDTNILNTIFKVVNLFNAHLHVIVFTDTESTDNDDYINQKIKLGEYEIELKKRNMDIKISSSHLMGSIFEDTLQLYIDEYSIDIVAMVTYKRSLLESIFNRSVTKKIAYRTRIPLLAIPGAED